MPRNYTARIELICEVCNKLVLLPPSIIAQGRRHCSAECMGIAKRRAAQFTCEGCGKVVETKPSLAATRKYCSMACRREHEKPRIVCEVCGKERRVTSSQLAQGARFCSWQCARKVLNKPRPIVVCEQCGKETPVPPSRIKQGMRFCSHSCRTIWILTHGAMQSPTAIEKILYRALEELKLNYIPQYPIPEAGTVADAYVPEYNLVLYADGDYWHTIPKTAARDKRQMAKLVRLGYRVHRMPEKDLHADPILALSSAF